MSERNGRPNVPDAPTLCQTRPRSSHDLGVLGGEQDGSQYVRYSIRGRGVLGTNLLTRHSLERMNGEGNKYYNVAQAAMLLRVPPRRILELIEEGDLEAYPSVQPGNWLIQPRSLHALLKAFPSQPQEPEVIPKTSTSPTSTDAENHVSSLGLLVLVAIACLTLLAAVYSLLPILGSVS